MNFSKICRTTCLVLLICCASSPPGRPRSKGQVPDKPVLDTVPGARGQRLTAEGKSLLLSILDEGKLPDLHRPFFEDLKGETKELYTSLDDSLVWISFSKPTDQARAMIRLLETAGDKGLKSEDYDGPLWDRRLARFDQRAALAERDLVFFDVALAVSAMRYVSDLNIGRLTPHLFHFPLNIRDRKLDLSEFVKTVLLGGSDIASRLQDLEPPFPAYRRTILALAQYRKLAREDDGERLPATRDAVAPGDSYSGVPRLLRLLRLLGDLPEQATARSSTIYQDPLPEAVKHFQERHGIEPTGLIDEKTLKALNTKVARRATQLELTLERWRWAPHEFVRPPIVVNIPEFRLHADDEKYHWALSMKVVVGQAYRHQTPVFASEIRSVLFRPYWNVPLSILRDEFIPKIEQNPAYLAENSFDIVDSNGSVVVEGEPGEEVTDRLRSGELGIRQRPGPDNALGLVKFDFPNQYDVYLHGTPAAELFSKSRRDFSHGCIRVEDPVSLAQWVLRDRPEWTRENIQSAMNGSSTVHVAVLQPIPVVIVYGTAVVMEDGEVRFFDDIYGYDAELERALALRAGLE